MAKPRIEQIGWSVTDGLAITSSGNYFIFDKDGNVILDFKDIEGDSFKIERSGSSLFEVFDSGLTFVSGDLNVGGTILGNFSGSITNAATASYISPEFISASAAASGFGGGGTGNIQYVTASGDTFDLSQIQVNDYDDNVAVQFVGGKLTFTFGTPELPSSINTSLSGFNTNRFNQVTDAYTVNASWNNGGYTLISASLLEDGVLVNNVGTGTSITYNTTTSGSHVYKLEYTASSPLDGSEYTTSATVSGNLSKSQPGNPSLSTTPLVQLGASSNQIEQGATGSISFTPSYGASNGWNPLSLTTTPTSSPILVQATSSISIAASANYESPLGDNIPQLTTTKTSSTTYSIIRSLRSGASSNSSFTQSELEDLALWDTTLGGAVGTINKGVTSPSGQSVTIVWSGDKYHYIVFDSSRSNLTNITTSGFGVLGQFTLTTVGNYKIYKTNTLQAGGEGSSITYNLT